MLKKEIGNLIAGKLLENELKAIRDNLSITDGYPEPEGVISNTRPRLPLQHYLFLATMDIYCDGAE